VETKIKSHICFRNLLCAKSYRDSMLVQHSPVFCVLMPNLSALEMCLDGLMLGKLILRALIVIVLIGFAMKLVSALK